MSTNLGSSVISKNKLILHILNEAKGCKYSDIEVMLLFRIVS